jgi:hypothetical protein
MDLAPGIETANETTVQEKGQRTILAQSNRPISN